MNETQSELINRAKENDGEAFSRLFKQYRPIVSNLFHSYYVYDLEWEDWMQEAEVIFYVAIRDYNELLGVYFSIYYKTLLKRHLFSLIRRANAKKRRGNKQVVSINSLNETDKIQSLMSDTMEFKSINQVIISDTIKNMIDKLQPLDQKVFCAYLEGKTLKEISDRYECSIYKTTQIMHKIKTRMITLLQDY